MKNSFKIFIATGALLGFAGTSNATSLTESNTLISNKKLNTGDNSGFVVSQRDTIKDAKLSVAFDDKKATGSGSKATLTFDSKSQAKIAKALKANAKADSIKNATSNSKSGKSKPKK